MNRLKLGDKKVISGKEYILVGGNGTDEHSFDKYMNRLSNVGHYFKLENVGKKYYLWMYTDPNHPHQIAQIAEIAENRRRFFEERERKRLLSL